MSRTRFSDAAIWVGLGNAARIRFLDRRGVVDFCRWVEVLNVVMKMPRQEAWVEEWLKEQIALLLQHGPGEFL